MPAGYKTYYMGPIGDLAAEAPIVGMQEESTPEETLVALEVHIPEPIPLETLMELNDALIAAGVPPWEGCTEVVFADASSPTTIYVAWVKGFAWSTIIIGILFLVIPGILGAVVWFLMPQGTKDMIMMMGMMMIMIPIMRMAG